LRGTGERLAGSRNKNGFGEIKIQDILMVRMVESVQRVRMV
jgi:hypothetical protein